MRCLTLLSIAASLVIGCGPGFVEPSPLVQLEAHPSSGASIQSLAPMGPVLDALEISDKSATGFRPKAPAPASNSACNEQPPQPFLVRGNYISRPGASAEEAKERRDAHQAAIEYRSRAYGRVDGVGLSSWNALEPKDYAVEGQFFGIPIKMNRRVLTALGCVEQAIERDCGESPYRPEVLDGLRGQNTFHNNEISNHIFGIAIDIDFHLNSCCGCVAPLSEWPRCKVPATAYERAAIPKCWVSTFERYGFYWLGHDVLEDTMHFEFLGDPESIVRAMDH